MDEYRGGLWLDKLLWECFSFLSSFIVVSQFEERNRKIKYFFWQKKKIDWKFSYEKGKITTLAFLLQYFLIMFHHEKVFWASRSLHVSSLASDHPQNSDAPNRNKWIFLKVIIFIWNWVKVAKFVRKKWNRVHIKIKSKFSIWRCYEKNICSIAVVCWWFSSDSADT